MGKMLDQWIQQYAPQLNGSAQPVATPGIVPPQARGVRTPAFNPNARQNPAFTGGNRAGAFESTPAQTTPPVSRTAPTATPVQPKDTAKKTSFRDVMGKADPKKVDAAIQAMESSGVNIPQAYQQATGNPPPKGASKRELGETLMEFGLSLLATDNIGQAGLHALEGRRQRQAGRQQAELAAEERRERRMDKQFDREVKLEQLALQREQIEAQTGKEARGTYQQYVGQDGFLYTYDEKTGEGTRVVVGGKPVKPSKKSAGGGKQYEFEVKLNRYMEVFGHSPDGTPLTGSDLRRVQEKALQFANRENPYTDAEARRDSVKLASNILKDDTDFQFATKEEKRQMIQETAAQYKEALLPSVPDRQGATPDVSKLQEGMATPVTDENGNTTYWTVQDGKARKVSPEELGQ